MGRNSWQGRSTGNDDHRGRDRILDPRVRHGLLLNLLPVVETIADVGDGQFVARPEPADFHPLTVDPDAVGASQVADDHIVLVLRHATVVARNPQGIEPCVALGMTTHDHHGPIQNDVGALVEGHQTHGHFRIPWTEGSGSHGFDRLPVDTLL